MLRKYEAPRIYGDIDLSRNCVCLEIGAGNGAGTLLIRQYTHCPHIVAVDVDPDMVAAARKRLRNPPAWARGLLTNNIEFYTADVSCLPFEDAVFHAVFGSFVFEHVPNWRKALAEVHRVLKRGGLYLFEEGYIPDRELFLNRYFGHVSFSEKELLNSICAKGFLIERYERAKLFPVVRGKVRKH